jgi:hypothetical protein
MLERQLPEGIKRALVVLTIIWIVGFYIVRKDDIDFSLTVATSTPSTMCSDVYKEGDDRLGECEAAGPAGWAERYIAKQRGEPLEVPFDHYQKKRHDFSVWYWLFGVPIVLFLLTHAVLWVREGLQEGKQ